MSAYDQFTLAYLQSIADKPGGRDVLATERQKLQVVRDKCAAQMSDTLADIDGALARLDLVLHSGVQA